MIHVVIKKLFYRVRKSAKSLSEAWRDRRDPLEVATDEIEHVARHGGHRRRSPARDLLPHQVLLLDVVLFLAVVFSVILFTLIKLVIFFIKLISNCINTSKPAPSSKKNKKE